MKTRTFTSRIAWLAILAVMWHALLPLAHAASAQPGSVLSSICSTGPAQLELIKLPAGKQDAPATVNLLKQCPLCATGAHLAIADAPGRTFTPDAGLAHVRSSVAFRPATHALAWLNFSPRAPPALA